MPKKSGPTKKAEPGPPGEGKQRPDKKPTRASRRKLRQSLAVLRKSILPTDLTCPFGIPEEEDEQIHPSLENGSIAGLGNDNAQLPSTPQNQSRRFVTAEHTGPLALGHELADASVGHNASNTAGFSVNNGDTNRISIAEAIRVTPQERFDMLTAQFLGNLKALAKNETATEEQLRENQTKFIHRSSKTFTKSLKAFKKLTIPYFEAMCTQYEQDLKEHAATELANQREVSASLKGIVDSYAKLSVVLKRVSTARQRLRSARAELEALRSVKAAVARLPLAALVARHNEILSTQEISCPLSSANGTSSEGATRNPLSEQQPIVSST